MKLTQFTNFIALGLVVFLAAGTGCRKRPEDVRNIPAGKTGALPDVDYSSLSNKQNEVTSKETEGIKAVDPTKYENWIPHPDILQAYAVHFAFDSSVVRKDEQSKVDAVADYLKKNSGNALRVEGHCDERGTAEYNRSLGERRALALREELVRLGINAGKVETVTFGFDRPVDPGHAEAAWAKNRRGEFIVLTPPAP